MKRGYVETSFGQMHYLTQGEGPVVLVMHATTHSAKMFLMFIPHLSDEYQVVAPDLFGFGNSDPLPKDITIPKLAESMSELLDEFGVDSAHVFGLHTGNKIGVAMGARMPDRVEKLVLCGLPHSIIPDEEKRDTAIAEIVDESLVGFSPTSDGAHLLKEWGDLHRRVTKAWWDPTVLSEREVTEADIDILAEQVIAMLQYRDSLFDIYDINYDYNWTADLEDVEPQTMILELAESSEIEQYGYQGEQLTEIIPDSTWISLKDATDNYFHSSPEMIATPTLEFLED